MTSALLPMQTVPGLFQTKASKNPGRFTSSRSSDGALGPSVPPEVALVSVFQPAIAIDVPHTPTDNPENNHHDDDPANQPEATAAAAHDVFQRDPRQGHIRYPQRYQRRLSQPPTEHNTEHTGSI